MFLKFSIAIPDSVAALATRAAAGIATGVKAGAAIAGKQYRAGFADEKGVLPHEVVRNTFNDGVAVVKKDVADGVAAVEETVADSVAAVQGAWKDLGDTEIAGSSLRNRATIVGGAAADVSKKALLNITRAAHSSENDAWRADITTTLKDAVANEATKGLGVKHIIDTHLAPSYTSHLRDVEHSQITLAMLKAAFNSGELAAKDFRKILQAFQSVERTDLAAEQALARTYIYALDRHKEIP